MHEEHSLIYVWLHEPLRSLLHSMGISETWADAATQDHVLMSLFIILLFAILLPVFKSQFKVREPGKIQQFLELIIEFFHSLLDELAGPNTRKYLTIVGFLGLFILTCNLAGLVPGLSPPTSNMNVTFALGLTSFIYYNVVGLKKHGPIGYLKHFCGPVMAIAFLVMPIEIISHIFRPISLSVRLFGNIFGDHTVVSVFSGLVPVVVPIPFMGLGVFVSCMQALIFVLLTAIYIGGAVGEEH